MPNLSWKNREWCDQNELPMRMLFISNMLIISND